MVYYQIVPTLNILWIPLLVFIMIITSAGVGMWLSGLAIQYRDVRHATQFLSQILMYAAPVVWPISLIADKFGTNAEKIYALYPMAGVIEGFRSALLGNNPMPWDIITIGGFSALFFYNWCILFQQQRKNIC